MNTFTTGDQRDSAVAIDATGNYIVVWQSNGQDGSGYGVYGQRFSAAGAAQGSEFQINAFTTSDQGSPTVAMDAAGDFVVTWQSFGQDGSSNSILARRYNSSGIALAGEFQVNTFTTSAQKSPVIAMNATGAFVIAWQSSGQDGDGYGVYAQRFSAAGSPLAAEFKVNTSTTNAQSAPTVAIDNTGDFVIAWQSSLQDLSGDGVFAQRYSAAGAPQGSEFQVNSFTTSNQQFPSVAMDPAGNFVIAWQSVAQDGSGNGIYAQRFNSAGGSLGSEFGVNVFTTGNQSFPSAASDGSGNFVIGWQSNGQDGIYAQHYDATGIALGTGIQVNTFTNGAQQSTAFAMNLAGNLVASWQSPQDGNALGIYSQRFTKTAGPVVTSVVAGSLPHLVANGDILTDALSSMSLTFTDNLKAAIGGGDSVINPSNWRLTRYGADISNLISVITFGLNSAMSNFVATVAFTQPLGEGVYQLVARQTIFDVTNRSLDGDFDGFAGGNFRRNFAIALPLPAGAEAHVNTHTNGLQDESSIATDAAGNYVIVWSDDTQEGNGRGVFGQRFSAAGVAQGSEFHVNTFTTGNQSSSEVAMDAAGNFVVVWSGSAQGGDKDEVFAQRYNSSGARLGSEFRVNSFTTDNQSIASIAMDAAGDFVVTWQSFSQDGDGFGIYGQRYNAAGSPQGAEFRVNTVTLNNQNECSVAIDSTGDFVVAWTSQNQDGSGQGVFAQRFNSNGTAQGSEFRVNTFTTGEQDQTSVAMDSLGNFVIAWESQSQDGDSLGVFGQRYTSAGGRLGTEFQINSFTTSDQENPRVSMDSGGDFIVVWESQVEDGSSAGIFAQNFTSSGAIQGSEFKVNSITFGSQRDPSVAMNSTGGSVVSWGSPREVGSYGIYAQRYQASVIPILSQIEDVSLNAVATQFTPVTSTLLAFDQDSSNWVGATIQITAGYRSNQDVLGFVNTANISGSFNTNTGILTLTGIDSVSNYRSALRSVTYHNTSNAPDTAATRTIEYQVNDGIANSNVVSRDITVQSASTPPVISGVSGTGTYSENATPLVLAPSLIISDVDSATFVSATVSFTGWQAEDRQNFNNIFALQHTFTQDLVAHTALFTITGIDTVDHYQTLLRSVVYSDVSDAPNTAATRVAIFRVNDGSSSSNVGTRSTVVSPINDPPLLSAIEATPLVYKANDPAFPPQPISSTLLVAEPDSNNLTKATVQITAGYQNDANGHDVLSFTNQSGITGVFDGNTGKLTLTGTSAVGNYRTALRSVTFSTSGSAVNTVDRTLTITGTDDFGTPATSVGISRTVTVSTTNVPPALTGIPATALGYVRGAAATAVGPALFVLDTDSLNLTGATIQVTGNYQNGQDILAVTNGSGITGSFNATTGTLTLTGTSTLANYQTVLRSVTYKTNTSGASSLTRTIAFILNDGLAFSSVATRNVTLT